MRASTNSQKEKVKRLADRYPKVVEWSDEDQCYVGRVPGLGYGGVHGKDRAKVFSEICKVAEEIVEIYLEDNRELPVRKTFSGKFLLRAGANLHEALSLGSERHGKSLNEFTVEAIQKGLKTL